MPSQIEHSGVVSRIVGDTVHVMITSHSACGSCKARQACGLAETQEKVVEVRTPAAAQYAPVDAVVGCVRRRAGGIAVRLAYVGALVVLLAVLAGAAGPLHWSEGHAALAALEMMDFEGIEKVRQRVRQNGTLAQQLARMQAQMTQLTGLLEVQKKSEAPKLSGPAQELSTAAMARAMKTQKGEMR